jgi:hypothetical protein
MVKEKRRKAKGIKEGSESKRKSHIDIKEKTGEKEKRKT